MLYPIREEAPSGQEELRLQRQLLQSKLSSLKNTLENLLQKKIRLDLEIRRTRRKITKVKGESKTLVKTSVTLEGLEPKDDDPRTQRALLEAMGPQEYHEWTVLEELVESTERLLQAYEDIPLYSE